MNEEEEELPTTEITDTPVIDPVEPERRLSPPVVVLDSSSDKDAISYKPRRVPSTDNVQLVITYVDVNGVIYGVDVDEGEGKFLISFSPLPFITLMNPNHVP